MEKFGIIKTYTAILAKAETIAADTPDTIVMLFFLYFVKWNSYG